MLRHCLGDSYASNLRLGIPQTIDFRALKRMQVFMLKCPYCFPISQKNIICRQILIKLSSIWFSGDLFLRSWVVTCVQTNEQRFNRRSAGLRTGLKHPVFDPTVHSPERVLMDNTERVSLFMELCPIWSICDSLER